MESCTIANASYGLGASTAPGEYVVYQGTDFHHGVGLLPDSRIILLFSKWTAQGVIQIILVHQCRFERATTMSVPAYTNYFRKPACSLRLFWWWCRQYLQWREQSDLLLFWCEFGNVFRLHGNLRSQSQWRSGWWLLPNTRIGRWSNGIHGEQSFFRCDVWNGMGKRFQQEATSMCMVSNQLLGWNTGNYNVCVARGWLQHGVQYGFSTPNAFTTFCHPNATDFPITWKTKSVQCYFWQCHCWSSCEKNGLLFNEYHLYWSCSE